MASNDNPYDKSGGYDMGGAQYTTNVGFSGGQDAAPKPAGGFTLSDAPEPAAGELIKDTTTAGFAADVIEESRRQPVLVDFWAPWCGPCRQLGPIIEKVVREARGKVKLVKMNIDEHPAVAGQLGVQSIPAVFAFKDGRPVDGFMGALPESQVKAFIDKLGAGSAQGTEIEDALAAAAEALEAGDQQMAAQIYSAVLQREPENVDALAGLAGLLYEAGQEEEASELLSQVPADKANAAPVAALKAKMALAEQVAGLGDAAAFEARLAADPADHQARFDLALLQNAKGDRAGAAENLLAIVRADRDWQEDGARGQLIKFFEAWGPTDPATLSARRKLSSLLFS
ncbi:thioredoxin [Nitratireductor indicus]|uniref:Thioredoxin n=1 Tax=Nitratireductor indicus C115 TaxID=1231190 RepID=K2MYN5_9HYPH|nr:thioredoxin [Nitratireductor indicus]EKF40378.1 thioredoxin [Nitratireductor indicus C115]MDS1136378.1 thioredoxin [Nitratireductor indicus]SFQ77537.1 thioredoxin [Nitratireductor indicus]